MLSCNAYSSVTSNESPQAPTTAPNSPDENTENAVRANPLLTNVRLIDAPFKRPMEKDRPSEPENVPPLSITE